MLSTTSTAMLRLLAPSGRPTTWTWLKRTAASSARAAENGPSAAKDNAAAAAAAAASASASSSNSAERADKWKLRACVLVERPARITKDLSELEASVKNMLRTEEDERSLLCEFELKIARDKENAEKKKRGEEVEILGDDYMTAEDLIEQWKKDGAAFQPASRRTKADEEGDVRSLDRSLDAILRLVVKQKFHNLWLWDLPAASWSEGETLRETAEKAVRECCGEELRVQVMGNAPCGFYQYVLPSKVREQTGYRGCKMFIYKAFHVEGNAETQKGVAQDFKWLPREEFEESLDRHTSKAVREILMEES